MKKSLFNQIVTQLLPEMSDTGRRQALIQSALFGSPVLNQIDWSGAAHEFTVRLVMRLHQYDETAVAAVLRELRTQVGTTRQAQIDELLQALSDSSPTTKGQSIMETGLLIGFLIEVGRWAKGELGERWKLRREQQSADLTDRQQVEQRVPEMLQAAGSPQRIDETIRLIERKRDAIYRARNAKLADREEYDAQRLTRAAFEQREADHNRTIWQMLDEIEADLADLGLDVERESV